MFSDDFSKISTYSFVLCVVVIDSTEALGNYANLSVTHRGVVKKYANYMPRVDQGENLQEIKLLNVLGLFEVTTHRGEKRRESDSEISAALLAERHVNEKNVLAGYRLKLLINDTQVRFDVRAPLVDVKSVSYKNIMSK